MKLRDWMNNNSAIVTVGAVALLCVAVGLLIYESRGPSYYIPSKAYFYDLNTGKLFAASAKDIPPIAAPSGPYHGDKAGGVKAYIYACGSCPDDLSGQTAEQLESKKIYVAYLEMYTAEAKQAQEKAMQNPNTMDPAIYEDKGHLVKKVTDKGWIETMMGSMGPTVDFDKFGCAQKDLKVCHPPD